MKNSCTVTWAFFRFFPIRGVNEKMDIRDIVRLLHGHVKNAYSSFKKAFLEIDKVSLDSSESQIKYMHDMQHLIPSVTTICILTFSRIETERYPVKN